MSTSAIIARLRAQVGDFESRVGGAAELAAAYLPREGEGEAVIAVPHAFVVPQAIDAAESAAENRVVQRVDRSWAVVVALDNTADARGLAAVKAMEALEAAIFSALLGWAPAEGWAPLQFEGGGQLDMDRARAWYQYDFGSNHFIAED